MKTIIKTALTTLSCLVLATSAFAKPMEQGGDIANGERKLLTKSSIVSYYKYGKAGAVHFICYVYGPNAIVSLTGGKNLTFNMPQVLNHSVNGPYSWQFHDNGSDVGNFKLKLVKGEYAYVQCQELG